LPIQASPDATSEHKASVAVKESCTATGQIASAFIGSSTGVSPSGSTSAVASGSTVLSGFVCGTTGGAMSGAVGAAESSVDSGNIGMDVGSVSCALSVIGIVANKLTKIISKVRMLIFFDMQSLLSCLLFYFATIITLNQVLDRAVLKSSG